MVWFGITTDSRQRLLDGSSHNSLPVCTHAHNHHPCWSPLWRRQQCWSPSWRMTMLFVGNIPAFQLHRPIGHILSSLGMLVYRRSRSCHQCATVCWVKIWKMSTLKLFRKKMWCALFQSTLYILRTQDWLNKVNVSWCKLDEDTLQF